MSQDTPWQTHLRPVCRAELVGDKKNIYIKKNTLAARRRPQAELREKGGGGNFPLLANWSSCQRKYGGETDFE